MITTSRGAQRGALVNLLPYKLEAGYLSHNKQGADIIREPPPRVVRRAAFIWRCVVSQGPGDRLTDKPKPARDLYNGGGGRRESEL